MPKGVCNSFSSSNSNVCCVIQHVLTYWSVMTQIWGGNPARFLRKLEEKEFDIFSTSAITYTNLAQAHAAENAKPLNAIEFEKVLRKKSGRKDEEYDSMLGIVRETPPELNLPNNIQPDKETKPPSNVN